MTKSGPRRGAVLFILITVTLDMLSLGMVVPVLPLLIEDFVGGDAGAAAQYYGLMATAWALMQFIFSPMLGALSDRVGRRPVIILSNVGLGLDYVLLALAPTLSWLFIGRIINGITAASVSTANAYIADVTAPENRAAAFGMVGAAFGVGFILGPAFGGLLGAVDPRLPFWVAAGLSLANALYGTFILPESLAPEKRKAFKWTEANPIGSVGLLSSSPRLLGLSVSHLLAQLAHYVLPSVWVLYGSYRYNWDAAMTGVTLAGVGVLSIIVQGLMVGKVVKWLGEPVTLTLGLSCGALGFVLYGLAETSIAFWAAMPVFALWGLATPAVQGLMTKSIHEDEQGRLQGALSSMVGVMGLIGPGLFTFTFAYFISERAPVELPGAPYFVAGSLMVLAILAALSGLQRANPVPERVEAEE